MAPIRITRQHLSSREGCIKCLSAGYFLPLEDWVPLRAASGKPHAVLRVLLTYWTTVKEVSCEVDKNSIVICPHGKLGMWAERGNANSDDRAWSKNVRIVYDMLKCFNVHTAHQITLE
jgi:hypothetical protein